jgi:hypothetical protein
MQGKLQKIARNIVWNPPFSSEPPFLTIKDPQLICMIKNLNYEFNLTSKIGSSFVVDLLVQMYYRHLVL